MGGSSEMIRRPTHGPSQRGEWTVWEMNPRLDVPLCDHKRKLVARICRFLARLVCEHPGSRIEIKQRERS